MKRFYIFQALVLFALPVVAEPQAQRPKATAADPWAVTTEDDVMVLDVYRRAAGNLDDKLRAAILEDRKRVKARVGETPAAAVKPRWILVDNRDQNGALIGKTLADLSVITKYDIPTGSSDVLLYEGGFATVRTQATPEIKAFLAQHFAATDLSTQAVPAAVKEARAK
jgi:hypothetical protein